MTLSAAETNQLKKAPAVRGVLPIIHSRWSPRSFSDRKVDPADLAIVFEAARWAASSYNEQPWRFLVGAQNSITYKKIFDSLGAPNQLWAGAAPVLILGAAKTRFSHNDAPNRVALYDLGAAASYLTLQASANLSEGPLKMSATLTNLGLDGKWNVRDLWRQKEIGSISGSLSSDVAPHGVTFVRLSSTRRAP